MTPSKQATISGIIFDFDGTLLDSAPDLMATVNKILESEGRRPVTLTEVQGMIGDGMPKFLERSLKRNRRHTERSHAQSLNQSVH